MIKVMFSVFTLFTSLLFAQNQGDIAFVGFNTDGDKDFAIATLADIPANTTIYFTDGEPNSAGTGLVSSGEGILDWNTGNAMISAGTIVVFTDIESVLSASIGTIVDSIDDLGFNLSAAGDNIFATLGNPATNNVTAWLAGIENRQTGQGANFGVTGLDTNSTYVIIDNTASKDGGKYNAVRTGKTVSEYRAMIADKNNWTTETSNGEAVLPFPIASFNFVNLSVSHKKIIGLQVFVVDSKIKVNKGDVMKVYNMLGEEVSNKNLSRGIYIVMIRENNKINDVKVAVQ